MDEADEEKHYDYNDAERGVLFGRLADLSGRLGALFAFFGASSSRRGAMLKPSWAVGAPSEVAYPGGFCGNVGPTKPRQGDNATILI